MDSQVKHVIYPDRKLEIRCGRCAVAAASGTAGGGHRADNP